MTEGERHAQPTTAPGRVSGVPRSVAGYRLLRQIGEGGMSAVFQSYDVAAGRPVAVKILADHLSGQPEFVGRFYREARLSRVLEHPSIVQGIASGYDPDVSKHYLVLEYIDGPTAHGALARLGRLPVGMVVRIGIDIACGLEFLHDRQYVHRDVKPDNILLHPHGIAKLADLGLAKRLNDDSQLTAIHQGVGTTYYMPYEQAVNANLVDGRSDLFALGATLYHLLTGEVPFPGSTHDEVIREKAHDSFRPIRSVNAGVPEELAGIIESMLACDPRARIQRAGRLAEVLIATRLATKLPAFAEGQTHSVACLDPTPEMPTRTDHGPPVEKATSIPPDAPTPTPPKSKSMNWPWIVGTGAVLLALLAGQWVRTRVVPNLPLRATVVQGTSDGLLPGCQQ
ncbi:Serine/threonine-protein kinase PrkC [Gemmata sp. SH-PL17]|uniref:serine/threonine-protein kinase n=1 Tax=Gemmata sp. SH-PL17 TaxID=1630693 RepID=UPI00078B48D6|nr:serine/threonine-protein kinase [Gemmata sp. SH-PL17]AMV26529.1 Serine/threonine-protein kinase PrkC [Gemmata sp. SH-PL17]